MEKLTIQHLSGYLPHELKVFKKKEYHSQVWENGEICTVFQIGKSLASGEWFMAHKEEFFNIGVLNPEPNSVSNYESFQFKPILHPLYDLTKPITHKGETFVPMHRLKNGGTELDEYGFREWHGYYACDNEEHKTSYDPGTKSFYQFYRGESRMCANQYEKFQKLLEWMFDLDDLIGKGLAIDVNSLTVNPYQ